VTDAPPHDDPFDAGFGATTRLVCRDCGAVYDPALGDPARGAPVGTSFARLPERWACPGCGAAPHRFRPASANALESDPTDTLTAAYRRVAADAMSGVAIGNPALRVEAVEFRAVVCGGVAGRIGCVVAPWFLNAVMMPDDLARWAAARDGDALALTLPSGGYRFNAARMGALGTLAVMPLVSDMAVFATQAEARDAAALALATLLQTTAMPTPHAAKPAPQKPKAVVSRRALFGRGAA
jgi:[NiFe] hydrogenase assembly HybE family chaperone